MVAIPGTQTPTEMQVADEAGADFVKLFPAPPNVAEYISYILGPQPHLNIFPTAGIDMNNMLDVLRAGAAGIGFVGPLFDPKMIEDLNFEGIRKKAEKIFDQLKDSGRKVIALSNDQIIRFAGNAIELQGRDKNILALSNKAYSSLTNEQISIISDSAILVPLEIPTIELSGGSVRCTIADIHLSPRNHPTTNYEEC